MNTNIKKGFTLIELLAVIVILAIIAIIATPMILGIIEKAKKGGAESSALGYLDAVEKTIATNMLDTNKTNIEDGVYEVSKLKSTKYDVKVKGEQPTDDSWVKIEKGQVTACSLKIGEYVINCNEETTKNGEITTKPDGEVVKTGPTKEEASETDTHKGIVYLDPTDLTKVCTKEQAESNLNENGTPTEVKTGCMKWYIYSEDESNYTMILDHNTTARIKWNDDNKNVVYESSNLYAVVEDLKTTSGWVIDPRIITAEEINTITGKTGWTSTGSWYCFDSKTNDTSKWCAKAKDSSSYKWLFNNLYDCENYGCSVKDDNNYEGTGTAASGQTYGYWTSTIRENSTTYVWRVSRNGHVMGNNVNEELRGIRPVITISKSVIF